MIRIKKWAKIGALVCLFTLALSYAEAIVPTAVAYADEIKDGLDGTKVQVNEAGELVIISNEIGNVNQAGAWTKILEKYRFAIVGVSGIGAVSMILFFIMNFIKLGATAHSPGDRAKVISALIYSGIAAAGLGSVTFIVGLFYGMLKDSQ